MNTFLKSIKRLLLFGLLISLSISFSGQVRLVILGGINNAKLNGDQPKNGQYKGAIGFSGALYLDVQLSKLITLSFQPTYLSEGTRVFYSLPFEKEPVNSLKVSLNYFSVPILVKISSLNQRWYAIGGLEPALLLDGSITDNYDNEETLEELAEWNLSVIFGAGVRFPLKFGWIVVELRYAQGLVNLTDEPIERSYIPRVKTTGTRLLVGYEIPLSKKKN